eukprot:scaffold36.g5061.t1
MVPQAVQEQEQQLLDSVNPSFTVAEVLEVAKRAPLRKSVIGPLAPWMLRAVAAPLVPLLAAEFEAWQRVGSLPSPDACSDITSLLKPGADPSDLAGLRGIADKYRADRERLCACFVDFKQAYDRVPHDRLWEWLREIGVGAGWLAAAQAIYADVPMTVAGGSHVIQTTIGVKQGCPLSPSLFGLYIDSLEAELRATLAAGAPLSPASLAPGVPPLPLLLYADDLALLSTSAAGLQAQLAVLEGFCERRGLRVNLVKPRA